MYLFYIAQRKHFKRNQWHYKLGAILKTRSNNFKEKHVIACLLEFKDQWTLNIFVNNASMCKKYTVISNMSLGQCLIGLTVIIQTKSILMPKSTYDFYSTVT